MPTEAGETATHQAPPDLPRVPEPCVGHRGDRGLLPSVLRRSRAQPRGVCGRGAEEEEQEQERGAAVGDRARRGNSNDASAQAQERRAEEEQPRTGARRLRYFAQVIPTLGLPTDLHRDDCTCQRCQSVTNRVRRQTSQSTTASHATDGPGGSTNTLAIATQSLSATDGAARDPGIAAGDQDEVQVPHLRLFSFASYREYARERAMYGPGAGPAGGGRGVLAKLVVVIVSVAIIASSWDEPCEKPLAVWLLLLPVGIVAYVAVIKFLYYVVRRWYPVAQQVAALAVYQAMFPLVVAWVIGGGAVVFGASECSGGVLYLFCFYLAIICLFYLGLVAVLCVVAGCLKVWSTRDMLLQGIANICVNRPFHAAPRDSLRSLSQFTYDPDAATAEASSLANEGDDSGPADASSADTCPICLETYERGQRLLRLPCDPPARHVFHSSCVSQWLSRSSVCPLCKQSIVR